jgi:hypothetical protein
MPRLVTQALSSAAGGNHATVRRPGRQVYALALSSIALRCRDTTSPIPTRPIGALIGRTRVSMRNSREREKAAALARSRPMAYDAGTGTLD